MGGRSANRSPSKLNLKNRPRLAYMSVFSKFFFFSRLLLFCIFRMFSGVFSGDLGFCIAIHIGTCYQFLHFFWVLASGSPRVASGLPLAKFYTLSQYTTGHIVLTMDFSNYGNIAIDLVMLLSTRYKYTWLTAISCHCLVALPDKKSAFNSHVQAKRLLP